VLRKRKGFVRIAMAAGAALVPCLHFGENELYEQAPNEQVSSSSEYANSYLQWTGEAAVVNMLIHICITNLLQGSWVRWTQDNFQRLFGFSLPVFYGNKFCPLLPKRLPIHSVVGVPLKVRRKVPSIYRIRSPVYYTTESSSIPVFQYSSIQYSSIQPIYGIIDRL
jgi:2-acylglycerol O-acyltransferase 2